MPTNTTLTYPAYVERDGPKDLAIVFPDVPEAVYGASTAAEAFRGAADVLALALCSYPERGMGFPASSPIERGGRLVSVPATLAAKLYIRMALAERKWTAADLARLIGVDHKSARRILSLAHNTRMDQLESILARLGIRVELIAA